MKTLHCFRCKLESVPFDDGCSNAISVGPAMEKTKFTCSALDDGSLLWICPECLKDIRTAVLQLVPLFGDILSRVNMFSLLCATEIESRRSKPKF